MERSAAPSALSEDPAYVTINRHKQLGGEFRGEVEENAPAFLWDERHKPGVREQKDSWLISSGSPAKHLQQQVKHFKSGKRASNYRQSPPELGEELDDFESSA